MSGISLETLLAAGRLLRSTSAAVMRACSILRQPPLHQKRNNDQDDNQGRENVSASTLVSIDTAPRRRFTTWFRPHLRTGIGRMIAILHAALAAEPRCLQHHLRPPAHLLCRL